jgi:rod shape determining protein RodA
MSFVFKNNLFIIAILSLFIAGFIVQYSNSIGNDGEIFNKHIMFFFIFLPISIALIFIPIERIIFFNKIIYVVNIFILISVLIVGKTAMGATRWFSVVGISIQPSEFVKMSVILMIASYFRKASLNNINSLVYFIPPFLLFILPVVLILLQPNLGTSIIICLISCMMIFSLFSRIKILSIFCVIALLSLPIAWKFGLHDYQKQRVLTFLNPESDASGAGYNIIQSKIAIGSGGVFGRGYLQGTQNKLNFLPERHTDFVFSVFAEEFGFIVTTILIMIYIYVIFMILIYAMRIDNIVDRLILIGCNALIFWHFIINIFMSMDLIPVVGVPLAFISYGRSFLLVNMICVSIIFNILRKNIVKDHKIQ